MPTRATRITRFCLLLAIGCSLTLGSFEGFTFEDVQGPDEPAALLQLATTLEEPATGPSDVNRHAPGEPMAFECGRFDMGHHCSAEADIEMEAAEQCQRHNEEGAVIKGSFVGCCRQVRINFLNQNFKQPPVVVASVLRPAELAHATFSTNIQRKKGDDKGGFTIMITREDECNCKEKGDCNAWCAAVEVLWMAYGPAQRDQRLGTGHFLGEYKHPYEAEVNYVPYLKKFPYRRPGENGRDGVGKGKFEFPLTGNPGFDMLIKGAAYSHLSSRENPIGKTGDAGKPRPKEWMLVQSMTPTTLIASTEVWSTAANKAVPLVAAEGARLEVGPSMCPEGPCLMPGDYFALVPVGAPKTHLEKGAIHPNDRPKDQDAGFGCEGAKEICTARGGADSEGGDQWSNCEALPGSSYGYLRANVEGYPAVQDGYQLCAAKRPKKADEAPVFVIQAPGDVETGEPLGPPWLVHVRGVGRETAVVDPGKVPQVLTNAVEKLVVHPAAWRSPDRQILSVRTDQEGAQEGEELALQPGKQYDLVVYKHGKRATVGDWIALVKKEAGFPCKHAPRMGNSFRIEPNWHVGPFQPQKSGPYELCWAPAHGEGEMEQDAVRQDTPPTDKAPAENDIANGVHEWFVQSGTQDRPIVVKVEGSDPEETTEAKPKVDPAKAPEGADLERRAPPPQLSLEQLNQMYQNFIGAPPARILRPLHQHSLVPMAQQQPLQPQNGYLTSGAPGFGYGPGQYSANLAPGGAWR